MVSRFDASFGRVSAAQERAFGVTVIYRRGELSCRCEDVLRGTVDATAEGDDTRVVVHGVSFKIKPSSLVALNSESNEQPQLGDTITTSDGDVYEIRPAFGDSPWRWTNAAHTRYEVFAVRRQRG